MKNDQYQCLWWQVAAYIAKNDSGSFGCVVTSKQCGVEKVNSAILDHQKNMTFKKRLWINQNLITLSDWGRSLCCRFFALY